MRQYHDGRPRGPLWRGKKLIGKEALFVILGLKRFKNDDDEKLDRFIKTHVFRLLKLDMIAVLSELERQEEVSLAVKVVLMFSFSVKCVVCEPFDSMLQRNVVFTFILFIFLCDLCLKVGSFLGLVSDLLGLQILSDSKARLV